MPKEKALENLLIFPQEEEEYKRSFERTPVSSLAVFLQCFDEQGTQVRGVPKVVLEFMASRIQTFFHNHKQSLDDAFGGKTKRQRAAIHIQERDNEVLFDFFGALEQAREIPREQRAGSTPFKIAVENTAIKHNMSKENVRKIYKNSKS